MTLEQLLAAIQPPSVEARSLAKRRWDSIAKPLGSLGLLEDAVVEIAGIRGNTQVRLDRRCVVVFCADHGIVEEGVTQTGQEVTAVVSENLVSGTTSVCASARAMRCDVLPVDIGVARDLADGLLVHKIAYGTGNIARGPAMTRAQALDALLFGASLAEKLKRDGYDILATGEMGIGNTTTSSAVASVLMGRSSAEVTGRGAGLSAEGLMRKIDAIKRAISVNRPDVNDPVDVIAKVGGFDLAGMTGLFLGAAACKIPVLIDGFISAVAALAAARLCPDAAGYALATHLSDEPAARMVLETLGKRPMITAGMRLGEGTGAVAALGLLDAAVAVYTDMSTFDDIAIDAYQPFDETAGTLPC